MGAPAIVFENVDKRYSLALHRAGGLKNLLLNPARAFREMRSVQREVLHNVTFAVERGESLGILGRNGAGKSTLLGLIAGVLRPSAGTIRVDGSVSPLLELGAGFHPELSGRDNIVLNGVLLGMRRSEVRERMAQIIDFSGLEESIDEPMRVYSTGMLARLGFSVVAHLEPEILLVDETLAVGDAAFQAKCIGKLKEFRGRGVTTVFVSHDVAQIAEFCDRALLLANHRVAFDGDVPDAVARHNDESAM